VANECLAVVAVDSTVTSHFGDEVTVHLLPFVEVIKETLSAAAVPEVARAAQ
jgi:hypothetical protein